MPHAHRSIEGDWCSMSCDKNCQCAALEARLAELESASLTTLADELKTIRCRLALLERLVPMPSPKVPRSAV